MQVLRIIRLPQALPQFKGHNPDVLHQIAQGFSFPKGHIVREFVRINGVDEGIEKRLDFFAVEG